MDRYIGKKLDGRYELREVIGIGGMAVVYAAYDLQEERMVAVKILKDEYLANDDFRRRFKTESKAISVLSHPNIVKVYDVCLGDRRQYIVMELIDGITLKEYIELQKVLRWKDAVHFITQILEALKHAHDKGIVHRDIKPQNILLLSDGNIKITDFGIARFSRSASQTMTDKAIGSVHYISPEQARGDVADERADVYSTGVMLYEMLTGTLPFNADSPVSVAIMQMQSEPPDPKKANPEIPDGLAEITLRAMQKDLHNRYSSAADMLADVETFKKDPEISFQYKYFEDNSKTRYVEAINEKKGDTLQEENDKFEETGYKSHSLQILFGIAIASVVASALFILGAVAIKTPFATKTADEVDLPNLVGLNYYDVIENEDFKKFDIVFDGKEYRDDSAKDIIYEQTPTPPKKVRAGSQIKVKVSSGPKLVAVTDVSGKEAAAAQKTLEGLGFVVRLVNRFDENIPMGYVISTDPPKNTEVNPGTPVTMYVSTKDKDTKVIIIPTEIINKPLNDAKNILLENGLQLGSTEYVSSILPKDYVVSSDPEPGQPVTENTVVNLKISSGDGYVDTSKKLNIYITNMPVRKFEYLVEIFEENATSPTYTCIMTSAMGGQFNFTARSSGGVVNYKIKVNGQPLRDIYVNFDLDEYGSKGIDYAVELTSGYVTPGMASSINAANSNAANSNVVSSKPSTSSTSTSQDTSSSSSASSSVEWPWSDVSRASSITSSASSAASSKTTSSKTTSSKTTSSKR